MTTISNFQSAMASPYLWEDRAAPALVPSDLEKAQKWLDEAVAKADGADKILMAYQSMYKSAEALLHARGYKVSNFRLLITALHELYVRKGQLDAGETDKLIKAQELVGTPEEAMAAAQGWLAKARQLTGK